MYYQKAKKKKADLILEEKIMQVYMNLPFYGYHRIAKELARQGHDASPKRVYRLMQGLGIKAIYPKRNLSISTEFLQVLLKNNIKISMNGKGRATDNAFMERTFRSLKYEEVYLNEYENMFECRWATESYFRFFNQDRIHQALDYNTPDEIYYKNHGLLEAS